MNNKTVVAFGEIMLRLTPPDSILNAAQYQASYGGSESNVLVALSSLGNATRYLTKLPDNDLGRGAVLHLQRYGVDCAQVISAGSNMGMYFLELGFAARPAKVIYARRQAEITTLQETDLTMNRFLRIADCSTSAAFPLPCLRRWRPPASACWQRQKNEISPSVLILTTGQSCGA